LTIKIYIPAVKIESVVINVCGIAVYDNKVQGHPRS